MSELFIKREQIREKIEEQYFADRIPLNKTSSSVSKTDTDTASEYSEESDQETSDLDISEMDEKEEDTLEIFEHEVGYSFLDPKEGVLERDFGVCIHNTDVTRQFKVFLCGYHIREDGALPFLQYHMCLEQDAFTFPSFLFHCAANVQVDEEEERSPEHVYFQNECMKRVLDILDIHADQEDQEEKQRKIENMYKGFIEYDQEKDTVFVFFDYTGFELRSPPLVRRIWGTVEEIVYHGQIMGFKVHEPITRLFLQVPELRQIKDADGSIVDTPSVLFLCKEEGGLLKNVVSRYESDPVVQDPGTIDEKNPPKEPLFSIIEERVDHPHLGNFYIFSVFPLSVQDTPVFRLRRFVGFLFQPTYILRILSTIERPAMENGLGSVIPTVVSYIASPPKLEETQEVEDMPKKGSIKDLEETLNEQADFNMTELANLSDIDNSCIYFQEYTGDNSQPAAPFWCIKSRLHFTEL